MMSSPEPDFDDELVSEAEAFESELRRNGDGDEDFERRHQDLAAVLRLLHDVFAPGSEDAERTAPERPLDMAIPSQLGRFQIVSLLGRGGFAIVYRAYDDVLQRDVAIKLIPRRGDDAEPETDKRLREARVVARLSHPNIVPLFEIHREGDAFCLVSEYCDGPTLGQWLHEHPGSIEPMMAAEIVKNLADGVAHAHGRGLAHRDIKPGNVLLAPTNERESRLPFMPRLTDFGLARDLEHSGADDESRQVAGTWEYMAPEQIRGEESESFGACDIHALGALLYRLLTGQQPYCAVNRLDLLREICTQPPRDVRCLVPSVPPDLEAICLQCLAKEPDDRYVTANALAEDLARWQEGRFVRARAPSALERVVRTVRRVPLQSALIAALLLTATIAAVLLQRDNRHLAERGLELESVLAGARASETRAILAEADTRAAARETEVQRQRAESNLRVAVATAYDADLSRGFEAIRQRRFAEADRIAKEITRYTAGLMPVGFDVRLLQALTRESWQPLTPHSGSVSAIVALPGTDSVMSSGTDGVIRQHALARGVVVDETRLGDSMAIWALACSPDGAWIAAGYVDHAAPANSEAEHGIALLPSDRQGARRMIGGLPTTVESLAFLPEDRLVVGCRYEPLQICSDDGTVVCPHLPSNRRNEEIVVSPNGETVTVYGAHRKLCRYSARDGQLLEELELDYPASHLASSPDGHWLAVSLTCPPYLLLVEASHLTSPCRALKNVFGEPGYLAFSPTGRKLAAGLSNGGIVVWELDSPTSSEPDCALHAVPHNTEVTALDFSDESHVLSGAADGTLSVLLIHSVFPNLLQGTGILSRAACLTLDGKTILIGGHDGTLTALDAVTGQLDPILPAQPSSAAALAGMVLSPDGHWLALAWENRDVALMDLRSRSVVRRESMLRPGESDLWQSKLAFDASGDRLAIAHHFDGVAIWKCPRDPVDPLAANGGVIAEWDGNSERRIAAICFLEDSGRLVYGGQSEGLRSIDFASRVETVLQTNASDVTSLLCEPHGDGVISGHGSGLIRRVDGNGRQLALSTQPLRTRPPDVRSSAVATFVLSPDGKRLLSGTRDGEVSLWDAATLRHLGLVREGDGQGVVTDLGLNRDGTRLLIHLDRTQVDTGSDLRLIEVPAALPRAADSP